MADLDRAPSPPPSAGGGNGDDGDGERKSFFGRAPRLSIFRSRNDSMSKSQRSTGSSPLDDDDELGPAESSRSARPSFFQRALGGGKSIISSFRGQGGAPHSGEEPTRRPSTQLRDRFLHGPEIPEDDEELGLPDHVLQRRLEVLSRAKDMRARIRERDFDEFRGVLRVPEVEGQVITVGSLFTKDIEKEAEQLEEAREHQGRAQLAYHEKRKQLVQRREKEMMEVIRRDMDALARKRNKTRQEHNRGVVEKVSRLSDAFSSTARELASLARRRAHEIDIRYGRIENALEFGQHPRRKRHEQKIDFSDSPLPIRLRVEMMRAVREKLRRGWYTVRVSLKSQLGGYGQQWTMMWNENNFHNPYYGTTFPIFHTGRTTDIEMSVEESVFTHIPPMSEIRPSTVLHFEVVRLNHRQATAGRIVAWGAFPLVNGELEIVRGRFKVPLLAGASNPAFNKFSKIEREWADNLDRWLANMYIEISHLPRVSRGGQSEDLVERMYTQELLGFPDAPDEFIEPEDAMLDDVGRDDFWRYGHGVVSPRRQTRDRIEDIVDSGERVTRKSTDRGPGLLSRGKGKGAAAEKPAAADAPKSAHDVLQAISNLAVERRHHEQRDFEDEARKRREQRNVRFRPITEVNEFEEADSIPVMRIKDEIRDFGRANVAPLHNVSKRDERIDLEHASEVEYDAAGRPFIPDEVAERIQQSKRLTQPSEQKKVLLWKEDSRDEGGRLARRLVRPYQTTVVTEAALQSYHYSISTPSMRRLGLSTRNRIRLVYREAKADIFNAQMPWKLRALTVVMLVLSLWITTYFHYMGERAYLESENVPVSRYDFVFYTVKLEYPADTVSLRIELGTICTGMIINLAVFAIMVGSTWLLKRRHRLPEQLSRMVGVYGSAVFLNPLFIMLVDVAEGRTTNGDAFKMASWFDRQDEPIAYGVFAILLVYAFFLLAALFILWLFFLYVHFSGRIYDLSKRLTGMERDFFVPSDSEVSRRYLKWVCSRVPHWRGEEPGTKRIVTVNDFEVTDSEDPQFKRRFVHIAIFTIFPTGNDELFRHFLRLGEDGPIIEVYSGTKRDAWECGIAQIQSAQLAKAITKFLFLQHAARLEDDDSAAHIDATAQLAEDLKEKGPLSP